MGDNSDLQELTLGTIADSSVSFTRLLSILPENECLVIRTLKYTILYKPEGATEEDKALYKAEDHPSTETVVTKTSPEEVAKLLLE